MKTLLLLSSFIYCVSSFACECKTIPNPLNEKVLDQGKYEFFFAEITKLESKKEGKIKYDEYTVKVIKKFNLKNYVETLTFRTKSGKCKAEFTVGQKYLISTSRDKEKIRWTDKCHFQREETKSKRYTDALNAKYKS